MESACQCRKRRFDPWLRKIPWRRKWQPTPVFLPGKLHGQGSLVGYGPWGCKELDITEGLKNNKPAPGLAWRSLRSASKKECQVPLLLSVASPTRKCLGSHCNADSWVPTQTF